MLLDAARKFDFIPNPVAFRCDEPYRVQFASVHSYVMATTGWGGPIRSRFWVLDTVNESPLRMRVRGKDLMRPPNSIALYAPGVAYEGFNERGALVRMAWLMIRTQGRPAFLQRLVAPSGYRLFEDPGLLVRELIGEIAACFVRHRAGADWLARAAFYRIMGLLLAAEGDPVRRIRLLDDQPLDDETSLRSRVERHLRAHATGKVSAHSVARAMGMSLSTFTHRYHEAAGETFVQTKMRCRIERAKILLLDQRMGIKQVALELGFADTAHFSGAFRHATGMSPSQFVREVAPRQAGGSVSRSV